MEWISVKTKMPEDDLPKDTKRLQIKVLVTTNHKGKKFVRVITRERWEFPVGNMRQWIWSKDATNVTHWMPLPNPAED